jgi:hypothetical protein
MQKRRCPATLSANGLVLLLALVVFLFSAFAAKGGSAPGRAEKLRIVELEGSPYQMGKAHGRTLKVEIQELVRRWKEDIAKTYGVAAEVFIRNLLKKTDFKPAIERWTPGLLDDVRGIADGPGLKALFQNRASGINNAGTYGCTIMVLGENPELHISPGRPDEAPFQVLAFSRR